MLILTREEIKYCVGVSKSGGMDNTVSGLVYNNKFFIKAKHYDVDEFDEAVKDCRENFLDNKETQLPTLMIKEDDSVSIWTQDNNYQAQNVSEASSVSFSTVKGKSPGNTSIEKLVQKMRGSEGLNIKTRRYKLKLFHHCFLGHEAVDWLVENLKISREKAVSIGKKLIKAKIIHHVKDEHDFEDGDLFYRFYQDEDKKIWTDKFI